MLAFAVQRHVAGRGGKGNRHAAPGVLDIHPGEARTDIDRARGAAQRPRERARQRVVAAGVQHDEAHPVGTLHLLGNEVDLDRLPVERGGLGHLGVDRDQVVPAVDREAVPGVEEQGEVGVGGQPGELAHRGAEFIPGEVVSVDGDEPEFLERGGDRLGIVAGISQRLDTGVSTVSDNKGHTLFEGVRLSPHSKGNDEQHRHQKLHNRHPE